MRRFQFSGFLADAPAHDQLADTKGTHATKPCAECKNVYGRMPDSRIPTDGVSIRCADERLLDMHTDDSFVEAYDLIANEPDPDEQNLLAQCLGIKVNPFGLLNDPYIRAMYKPCSHRLRDWMHILVGNGLANIQVAMVVRALASTRLKNTALQSLSDFAMTFTLPSRHGKVEPTWLSAKRLGKAKVALASFSGIMLSIVPIVNCYLQQTVPDGHDLSDHVKCFALLTSILGICALGPVDAVAHVELLRELIREHHEMYVQLYPKGAVKPKFHQLLHLPNNIVFLNRLLSCFVTERKHREAKKAALHVFRNIDNTVIGTMVHNQCEAVCGTSGYLFKPRYLVKPHTVGTGDALVSHAKCAVLPSGSVRAGDIVYLKTHEVGKVINFWGHPTHDEITVRLAMFRQLRRNVWSVRLPHDIRAMDTATIVDAVMWSPCGDGEILIIPPFRVELGL